MGRGHYLYLLLCKYCNINVNGMDVVADLVKEKASNIICLITSILTDT